MGALNTIGGKLMHWKDMLSVYPDREIGRTAFEQGATESENPYNEYDEIYRHRNWRTGFRMAERDHEKQQRIDAIEVEMAEQRAAAEKSATVQVRVL